VKWKQLKLEIGVTETLQPNCSFVNTVGSSFEHYDSVAVEMLLERTA